MRSGSQDMTLSGDCNTVAMADKVFLERLRDWFAAFRKKFLSLLAYIVSYFPSIGNLLYIPLVIEKIIKFISQFPNWFTINILSLLNSCHHWLDLMTRSLHPLVSKILVVQIIIAGCHVIKFALLVAINLLKICSSNFSNGVDDMTMVTEDQLLAQCMGLVFYTLLLLVLYMFPYLFLIDVVNWFGMLVSYYHDCYLPYKQLDAATKDGDNKNLRYFRHQNYLSVMILCCYGVLYLIAPWLAPWIGITVFIISSVLNISAVLYKVAAFLDNSWAWLAASSARLAAASVLCILAGLACFCKAVACLVLCCSGFWGLIVASLVFTLASAVLGSYEMQQSYCELQEKPESVSIGNEEAAAPLIKEEDEQLIEDNGESKDICGRFCFSLCW